MIAQGQLPEDFVEALLHTARLAGVATDGLLIALRGHEPAELLGAILQITWAIEDAGAYFYSPDTAF